MVPNDLARAYRANSILTASPGQLVLLMYDAALTSLAAAQEAFNRPSTDFRKFEAINRHLRKARNIIAELKRTLNFEIGGEFAPLMSRLYDYYSRRLLEANIKKDPEPIKEVERLLGEVRSAWAEMLRNQGSSKPALNRPMPVAVAS